MENNKAIYLVLTVMVAVIAVGAVVVMMTGFASRSGTQATCTDSDRGNRIFIPGKLIFSDGYMPQDDCVNTHKVIELSCSMLSGFTESTNYPGLYFAEIKCPNGFICKGSESGVLGSCISTTSSCVDSDGGKVYNTYGRVLGFENGEAFNYHDDCNGNKNIIEQYCRGSTPRIENKPCPGSKVCRSGVCIAA